MDVKKCFVCKIKIDKDNYKKDRNICKNCYNMNRKKYNKITTSYQQPKNENVSNSNNKTEP